MFITLWSTLCFIPSVACFVKHFLHIPLAVGLILQLVCSPTSTYQELLTENITKHHDWGDETHCRHDKYSDRQGPFCGHPGVRAGVLRLQRAWEQQWADGKHHLDGGRRWLREWQAFHAQERAQGKIWYHTSSRCLAYCHAHGLAWLVFWVFHFHCLPNSGLGVKNLAEMSDEMDTMVKHP